MKKIMKMLMLLVCVAVISGFGDVEAKKEAAKPAEAKKVAAPTDEHGEVQNLGKQTVGVYTVEAIVLDKIVADKTANADVKVKGGTPKAVRAWVGLEEGVGSVKTLAEEKEPGLYHVCSFPVPAKLAEGVKFWVELEGEDDETQLVSFAI